MKKTIIALLAALPLCASAQLSNLFKTDNQALVEQAIADGVVLIKQSYQLADSTGKRYGRYGEPEFGTIISLGYRVDSGLVVPVNIAKPWEYDENFERYRGSYTPELFHTSICSLAADKCHADSLQLEFTQVADDLYYTALQGPMGGYAVKNCKGATDGWMAWIYADNSEENPEPGCNYMIVKQKLTYPARGGNLAVEAPQDGKDYVGGVYVVPEQTAVGQLTFFLAGIALQDGENGSWVLTMPKTLADTARAAANNPGVAAADELTPTIGQGADAGKDGKKDKKSKDKKGKDKKKK